MNSHISIATPNAPPKRHSISFITFPVLAAAPVCSLGADVELSWGPAVPVRVGPRTDALKMVVCVTSDWLPLDSVLVCTATLVRAGTVVDAEIFEEVTWVRDTDETVLAPPPIVVTITTPKEFVIVEIWPAVLDEVCAADWVTDDSADEGADPVVVKAVTEPGALVVDEIKLKAGETNGVTRAVLLIWFGLDAEGLSSTGVVLGAAVGDGEDWAVPLVAA